MRKRLTWLLIILLFGAGSILVGSYIVESQTSDEGGPTKFPISTFVNKDEINEALDLLARHLATALADPELRLYSKQKLEKILRKDRGFELKWLLTGQGYGSSILKDYIKTLNIEKNTYAVDDKKYEGVLKKEKFLDSLQVGMLNFEIWDDEFVTPLVAVMPFDVRDEDFLQSTAYDSKGNVVYFDSNSLPDFTVVLLQINDDIVRPPKITIGKARDVTVSTLTLPYYKATPLIIETEITDIHESGFNGPYGFAYFSAAGDEKTGNLPSSLGGRSNWKTWVWASNFQGPYDILKSRWQWEFTADGWPQRSYQSYPFIYDIQVVSDPNNFTGEYFKIMEDDDHGNPDDYVGKAIIDCRPCKEQIFDQGLLHGWTETITRIGISDVKYTKYQLYCEKFDLPCAPVQISPGYNSTVSSLNPILNWNNVNAHPEILHYWVDVYNITTSRLVYSNNLIDDNYVQLPTLEYNCKYRWSLRAFNVEGWGPMSPEWTFWTPSNQSLPGAPSLYYPFHNSTISSLRPTFDWYPVEANPQVDIYRLMIRKVQGDVIVFNQNVGNITSYQIPAGTLENNTEYKWQVRPHNSLGWGTWSGFWRFAIIR